MALIKCPECEQTISDKASKCPKCGYPIQEYLGGKTEESQTENFNDASVNTVNSADIQQDSTQKKSKKKTVITLLAVCVVVVAALSVVLGSSLFTPKLTVKDITISKWRLTDSTKYFDYYEGTIISKQKKPFVAVIGRYEDEGSTPEFVYVEDGKGIMETYEVSDKDPSVKYRPIGYLGGTLVDISDIKVKYTDSDYDDYSYSQKTSCDVLIDLDMNNSKNGLLVFDIINETNNETERNMIAVVIDGKAEYSYNANLPYKARGIDVSIEPKMFCESDDVTQEDYVVEKKYTAKKSEEKYFTIYSGEEILSFADYADGFVLYTEELKEGGNKKDRNVVSNSSVFLHDGECTLKTYDSVDADETILKPKYKFKIIGYITWTPLEKETI